MSDLSVSAYVYLPLKTGVVLQFHQLNSVLLVSESFLFAWGGIQTFSLGLKPQFSSRIFISLIFTLVFVLCFRVGILVTNLKIWVQLISPSAWELKTLSQNFDKINMKRKKCLVTILYINVMKCPTRLGLRAV